MDWGDRQHSRRRLQRERGCGGHPGPCRQDHGIGPATSDRPGAEQRLPHDQSRVACRRNGSLPSGDAGRQRRSRIKRPVCDRRRLPVGTITVGRGTKSPRSAHTQRQRPCGATAHRPLPAVASQHGRGLVSLVIRRVRFRVCQCEKRRHSSRLVAGTVRRHRACSRRSPWDR